MIHIKKLIIMILIMVGLLVVFIPIFFLHPTETIVQKVEEKVDEITSEPKSEYTTDENSVEDDSEEVAAQEDPVREYLSKKIKRATEFFFTRDLQIVTLGDSLTEGVGDETNAGGYVGILETNLNHDKYEVEIQNFAKRGSRTSQLLTVLEDEEVIHALVDADIILITIGANDIMQVFKENFTKLTLEKFESEQIQYEQRLHEIFTAIRNKNGEADVYLIGFYNPFQQYFSYIEELDLIVDSWNNVGLQVAQQYDYTYYVPIKDLFEDTSVNYFADDHFHPNHLGYRLIADRVLQYVTNEGENYVEVESASQ